MERLTEEDYYATRIQKNRKRRLLTFIIVALVIALISFGIGFALSNHTSNCADEVNKKVNNAATHKVMVGKLDASQLEKNLRYFSALPHAASSPRNNEILEEIYRRFESYGFETSFHPYDVLLTFPNLEKRNHVYLLSNINDEIYKSKGIEDFLEDSEKSATGYPSFHANSPSGTVEGELIYANYGRHEDFEELEKSYGQTVTGKIVIIRYGKIYRGDKVFNAEKRGAIGVLMYSDPKDYAPEGKAFINGRWLPSDGMQRGNVLKKSQGDIGEGDPLTPGYPAKSWAYRPDMDKVKGFPRIPSQPISADDAYNLMKDMKGQKVKAGWTGSLNLTYSIGPHQANSLKVKLEVFNEQKVKSVKNVCGTIKGSVEPDRLVILGNHIDSWVFGAVDPSSGTTVMMEIARVLGESLKTGWRPRRTIKLCGWDGEEQGIMGSGEFVEEFRHQLSSRGVAYINVDSAVWGNESLACGASPLLHQMIFDSHKEVSDPFDDDMTVFDRVKSVYPSKKYPEQHRIGGLGSGSDYAPFYQFIGLPSIDVSYGHGVTNRRLNVSFYPVYHSLHDTFYWVKNFVDREFTVHLTVARVAMNYLLKLADTAVIPFDLNRYAERIESDVTTISKTLKKEKGDMDVAMLESASSNFTAAVNQFLDELKKNADGSALDLRIINDQMMQLEKGFIYVDGLPGRKYLKHYIMAPSKYNSYGSSTFPAISDTLFQAKTDGNWDEVKRQITITAYLINNVANSLKSLTL